MQISEASFSAYHHRQQEEINRYLFGFLKEKEAEDTLNLLYYALKRDERYQASLCCLISDLFQGDRRKAVRYASLSELIRTAVLIHDEVVDDDRVRDGMPSLWRFVKKEIAGSSSKFNPKNMALLLADGLLANSLSLVNETEALHKLTNFLGPMTEGAISEHKSQHRPPLTTKGEIKDYLQTVKRKRGSLFALAAQLGGLTGGRVKKKEKRESLLASIGYNLGLVQHLAGELARGESQSLLSDQQGKEKLRTYTTQFLKQVKGLPKGPQRQLLKKMPFFLANRLLADSNKDFQLELR